MRRMRLPRSWRSTAAASSQNETQRSPAPFSEPPLLMLCLGVVLTAITAAATAGAAEAESPEIRRLVLVYQEALNAGNSKVLSGLFEETGAALIQGTSAKTGTEAVGEFYEDLFSDSASPWNSR